MRQDGERDDEGKYKHRGGLERLCRCGHSLGEHAAAKVGGDRPCFHGDTHCCEPCYCTVFKPKKEAVCRRCRLPQKVSSDHNDNCTWNTRNRG